MWADQGHRWPYCLAKELELNLAATMETFKEFKQRVVITSFVL